ncbi:TRAP transporter small permease [Nioella sp.]|uniref:TRAP transporter small permease n=1 Tax=Nioella sp. TaxID=1912091 RepID=UPI003A844B99
MTRFSNLLEHALRTVMGLLCIVLLLCLFVEVLNRYVFFVSWPIIQFIVPFCFLWMCMIGSAIAVRRGQHFEVDLVAKLLPGRAHTIHRALMLLSVMLGAGIIIVASIPFLEMGMLRRNAATGISMIYIYPSLMVGGVLMALLALEQLLLGPVRDGEAK